MCIMLRLCEHGIITQQAPSASFLYQLTAVLRSFVVKTTARRSTRKYTQIVDRSKDVQVKQATSHLTRPAEPCARNHRRAFKNIQAAII